MKSSLVLLKRTPLIKFIGGPHKHPNSAAGVHPMAPSGLRPTQKAYLNTSSIEPKQGEYFSRAQLPKRFRYTLPKSVEADNITSGGAEVVF